MATKIHCDRCDAVLEKPPGTVVLKRHHKTQIPLISYELCDPCVDGTHEFVTDGAGVPVAQPRGEDV